MKVQAEFRDLAGYQLHGAVQKHGPLSICAARAVDGRHCWVEEIRQESSEPEFYARLRRQWQQNVDNQPRGSLRQRDFIDSGDHLTRAIDVPVGAAINDCLFRQRFSLIDALETATSLTECLVEWHKAARIHGGLSGDCIFRDSQHGIELRDVDFMAGQFQQDFSALPAEAVIFFSPESSGSLSRAIGPASDLYSVGVLIFSMVAGRPPIEAQTASEYLHRQLCLEAPRLRELGFNIPAVLDDIVARLLRRDPRDRYETANGLLYDLGQVSDDLQNNRCHTSLAIGTRDVRQTLTEANLVGRDEEIEAALSALIGAPASHGSVQLVIGTEASSRQCFLDEVALICLANGMNVFRGGASAGNPKPLQTLEPVLAKIAKRCIDDLDLAKRLSEATSEHGGTLAELLPALAGLWPNAERTVAPDAYGSRRAAFALEELFAAFAVERENVMLLFDDLDLADDLTKTVVHSLVDRLKQERGRIGLHILVSCESPQSLDFCAAESTIKLGPLTDEALASYLQSMAGRLADGITAAIVEVASGDPMMASTILRRMIDTEVVKASPLGWRAQGPLSESLFAEQCIAESLERQIDALSPSALRIMSVAAVVGQHFQMSILPLLTGATYAEVLEVCNEALRRRLLWKDAQPGRFRFAHNQIHQKSYLSLELQERRRLHLQTAKYLEENDPTNVFELAAHYDAAGDRERALANSLQAAETARQQYSLSIARDQLTIAKRWLPKGDRQTGLKIWAGLGEIELLAGQYDQAAVNLKQALLLTQPGLERAMVQKNIGELAFKRGRFSEAAREYEHALAMTGVRVPGNFPSMLCSLLAQAFCQLIHTCLPTAWIAGKSTPSEFDILRLQLLSRLSHVYWFSRHKLWTLGNHLRSLNTAERFAPSATLAAVYSEHGPVMSLLRWFKRANHYAERSLAIRKDLGDVWGQGQSYHYQSVVKLAECRFQDAIGSAIQAVELLRKMGDVWEMNMARYQAANAHYRIGNYSEATELATQMFETGCQIGDLQATGISLDVWARTSPHTLPLEIVAAEAVKERPDAQSNAQTQLAYAVVLLHHGRTDEAIEVLRNAISRSQRAGHLNTYISPCYAWLGTALRLSIEQTEHRDGRHLHARISEANKAIRRAARISRGFSADRAHCLRELGLLHSIRGKVRSAADCFTASLASAQEFNQPTEELATLKCLLHLDRLEPELLVNRQASWQSRLDELNQAHNPVGGDRATDPKSSNLSLADRFVTVLQSGRRIAQALSADVVYREASEAARKLLRGQHVDVVSIHQQDDHCSFAPLSGTEAEQASQTRIQLHESIIRAAHLEGQAVCDTALRPAKSKIGSAIAAPIAFRGTNVAVILVTHDELKDVFNTDEQRIADFVSTLAGAALENADGFLRLRQLNDTLEQRVLERTEAAEQRAKQLTISNEQLRATEDQLREAIVHANAANEAKSRFLATISHEIRTPLNGILGMTRLARESADNQRQANYLDTVQESGESLLTLINDLLDVSKLESGKLELEHIELNPRAIAGEICRLMAASAWQKSVELVCDIDPAVPKTVFGDPSRLRQIVMNLIGNAIKFTEQGFVALKLDLCRQSGAPDSLCIRVKDSGIGIPADRVDSVFESFSQVDSSTTRRFGGTGLGLAICRELTEMMGGSISLKTELGRGSEFTVRIPIPQQNSSNQPQPSLRGRRIAVIDPLAASREAIERSLRSVGAEVKGFASHDKLSNRIAKQEWDLVVFGGTDLKPVSRRCATRNIPSLYLVPGQSVIEPDSGNRCIQLRKPALSDEVIQAAEDLILRQSDLPRSAPEAAVSIRRQSARQGDSQLLTKQSDQDLAKSEPISQPPIRILVAEDGLINQEVIVGMLEMRGYEVIVANNGEEAVQQASTASFALCLMDVDMPKMDGIQATRMIRMNVPGADRESLPIIAMTAHCGDQIWAKCEAAGMNGYIPKPIDPKTLFENIDHFQTCSV